MSGFNKITGGNSHSAYNMQSQQAGLPAAKGSSLLQQLQGPKGTGSVYAQSNQFHGNGGGNNDIMALLKLLMSIMQKSEKGQQTHGAGADQSYQSQGQSGNNDMMALIQLLLSFLQKSGQGSANAQGSQSQNSGGGNNDIMALLQLLQSLMQKPGQGGGQGHPQGNHQGNGFPHIPHGQATGHGMPADTGYPAQGKPHPFSQIGNHQPQLHNAGNDNGKQSSHC